ncbi:Myc-type [Macleaya cordata]|uniref:Myc-type n=1 Tax=Macleaya cordata TaxID=56857 RepID=A0A200QU96_MACCD|nr:Myc-type [Macleaya cordata]
MATGLQKQEGVPENHLKQQLAVAVRSIQWSYAIFWTISTRNQGVLEWGAGYYNGDIKTRKTVQPMEFNANQLGLQRSEQLRELYESLSVGETNQQARRPSASLSPEDLSDAEWYYLVCMSFTFNPGQGLPGRALANGQHIWLCEAHCADSKVFIRSLLAKVGTVVCFPFLGGVVELGVTELVPEDLTLLQHVKTVFLEFKKPSCSDKSTSSPRNGDKNDEDPVGTEIGHEIADTMALNQQNTVAECEIQPLPFNLPHSSPKEEIELDQNGIKELNTNIRENLIADSPEDSSNGCEPNQQTEDSYMMDGVNGGASQVQSWQFMDDELELSNGIHGSMNSSDCISQTFLNPEKAFSSSKLKKINNLQGLQECNHTKLSELDLGTDDLHYSRTLSAIFKTTNLLIVAPCSRSCNKKSSFGSWKKGSLVDYSHKLRSQTGTQQKLLKKILFEVAWMHSGCSLKTREEKEIKNGIWKPEGDDIGLGHERRREELNEKFIVLRSLVPSVKKFDQASILSDTIDYLKELERRVEELESCRELTESEARDRRKHPDIVERTSDNYGIANGKKPVINKRKACDIDEVEPEQNWVLPKDTGLATYVTVCMIEKEILIEISCPWRECLLLEIMDAISDLHLDAHSVQSSNADGVLTLNLKSKFKGAAGVASAGMIKQAIQRVISKF